MFDDYVSWDGLLADLKQLKGKEVKRRTVWEWQRKKGFPRTVSTPAGYLFYKPLIRAWWNRNVKAASLDRFAGA